MGLPIERWARQATILQPPPRRVREDSDDLAHYERLVLPRLGGDAVEDALAQAMREQHGNWRMINGQLVGSGQPTALESFFAGPVANAPAAAISTASINGEVGLWPAATYTPIPANTLVVPEVFRICVTGRITTAATPANWTLQPRIGTTTGGSTLGASSAIALTASITNADYYLLGDLTCRSIGPTTTASMIGFFNLSAKLVTAGAGAKDQDIIFGHTVATFDSTAAQGLFMGATHTVTTITHNIQQVHWMSWN